MAAVAIADALAFVSLASVGLLLAPAAFAAAVASAAALFGGPSAETRSAG